MQTSFFKKGFKLSKLYLNTADLEKLKIVQSTDYYDDKRYQSSDEILISLLNPLYIFEQVPELPISATVDGVLDVGNSGVIFSKAKGLPDGFKESISYWHERSESVNFDTGAVYYQNPAHEYMIDFRTVAAGTASEHDEPEDEILTEGYVVKFNLTRIALPPDHVVELQIKVNAASFCHNEAGMDLKADDSSQHLESPDTLITVYVKTEDVLAAPSRVVWLDLIGYSMLDYGYYY
jgi:hypothetical protein